ncbi:MAG: nucleotidyltransferase domain-containing protein [Schwartzia sp.]|nr:nucleotidyltransferase domain-containing protein [Schwartzia sp. (in: firmicutes)]
MRPAVSPARGGDEYIERICRAVLDSLAGTPARVYLFGSWARGTPHRASDVDIAIDCGSDRADGKIAALREFLEESTIPYRVDVVDMRHASESLREEIRREGVLWKQ